MSQREQPDIVEIDPLFAFTSESPQLPEVPQPTVAPPDPAAEAPPRPPSPPPSIAFERIEQLERNVDESRAQIAAIKSEAATLVRAIEDIRKRMRHPVRLPMTPAPRVPLWPQVASGVAAMVIGIAIGIGIWMRFTGGADLPVVSAAEAAPAATAPAPAEAAPEPVHPQPGTPVPPPPSPVREPARHEAAAAVTPVRYTGTLTVDADPGGRVFINRETVGNTPLRLPNLRAGAHLVWIERDGYRRWTRVVEVPAERVTHLSASLEPLPR